MKTALPTAALAVLAQTVLLFSASVLSASTDTPSNLLIQNQSTWKLVWSDEFNGSALDTTKWSYLKGGLNYSAECNTNRSENIYVRKGRLHIITRRESPPGNPCTRDQHNDYTSAYIRSIESFTYGRVEMRAKLPAVGTGIWPAFWLREGTADGFYGEIDIMEQWSDRCEYGPVNCRTYYDLYRTTTFSGTDSNRAHNGKNIRCGSGCTNIAAAFHIWAVEWEPSNDTIAVRYYFDGRLVHTTTSVKGVILSDYVDGLNDPFQIRLNTQVVKPGDLWHMPPDSDTPFPAHYQIDWVRVYQKE